MEVITKIEISKISKIILISFLGTLLLTLSAKVKIPLGPVPQTMQTFVVLFLGVAFGARVALLTVSFYLLQGIFGLPVFSGTPEKGIGLIYFTGPTMGYLIGFIPAVFFTGFFKVPFKYNLIHRFLINFVIYTFSVSFIYIFGLIWLTNFVPFEKVVVFGALPFLPAELLKISILAVFATLLNRSILSWRSFR